MYDPRQGYDSLGDDVVVIDYLTHFATLTLEQTGYIKLRRIKSRKEIYYDAIRIFWEI